MRRADRIRRFLLSVGYFAALFSTGRAFADRLLAEGDIRLEYFDRICLIRDTQGTAEPMAYDQSHRVAAVSG